MRFRGKIVNLLSIKGFAQLVHTISRVGKQLVIRIRPEDFVFVLSEREARANGVKAWCEFLSEQLFEEYTMEGISAQANEIYLEVPSEYLDSILRSMKSSFNTIGLKLKLTKKCVPCLTIEVETQTANSVNLCVHDIPISIIPQRHWNEYQQPELPVFNISVALPEIKVVRQTIERLKNLNSKIAVIAKSGNIGKIMLSVESLAVKSSVTYSDLKIYEIDGRTPDPVEPEQSNTDARVFRVEVEMKNVLQVIPTDTIKAVNSICSIVDGRLLHFFYIFNDATLQYIIPGLSLNN